MFPPRPPTGGDASIRSTDNDAAVARVSAVKKGYCEDPFINHFVPRAHFLPPRPPLINIGTYVRSTGIDMLVDQWLSMASQSGQRGQIVSLGAGSDTRFWRIAARQFMSRLRKTPSIYRHRWLGWTVKRIPRDLCRDGLS